MVRKIVSSVRWYEAATEPLSAPFHHMDADLAALETRTYVFPEEVQGRHRVLECKIDWQSKTMACPADNDICSLFCMLLDVWEEFGFV